MPMAFLFPIHILVLVACLVGMHRLRKIRNPNLSFVEVFRLAVPWWIAVLAILVFMLIRPLLAADVQTLGTTSDGTPINHRSWYEKDGHYFEEVNRGTPLEISAQQYQLYDRNANEGFAAVWTLFSFMALAIWHYILRRTRNGNGSNQSSDPTLASVTSPAGQEPRLP
jgi:hypothetical protein